LSLPQKESEWVEIAGPARGDLAGEQETGKKEEKIDKEIVIHKK